MDQFRIERSRALHPLFYRAPSPENGKTVADYQHAGAEYILARDNGLIGDEPGVGKTLQAILVSNTLRAKHTLVVCPASLRLNWEKEIWMWSDKENVRTYPIMRAKDGVDLSADWVIISYDLLRREEIMEALLSRRWDHVIYDECFPPGTLVDTEKGRRDIRDIVNERASVRVWAQGPEGRRLQRITRYIRTPAPEVFVEIAAGQCYLLCTANHKVWSKERGYVRAEELREGETVRLSQGVAKQEPRKGAGACEANPGEAPGEIQFRGEGAGGQEKSGGFGHGKSGAVPVVRGETCCIGEPLLRSLLFCEVANGKQAEAGAFEETSGSQRHGTEGEEGPRGSGKNEKAQFRPGFSRQSGRYIEVAEGEKLGRAARGEWFRYGPPDKTFGRAPVAVASARVFHIDQGSGGGKPSFLLQSGLSLPRQQDRDRGRRGQPQDETVDVSGPTENQDTRLARVDRVSVIKRGDHGFPGEGSGKSAWVYNLEIEEDHNFFANGVQVSNCHAIKDPRGNKRTQSILAADRLPSVAGRTTLLSGTPMPNQPIECYNAVRLLDWNAIDRMSLEDFREYYYAKGEGMVRRPVYDEVKQAVVSKLEFSTEVRNKPRNLPELQARLRGSIMIRRSKADVMPQLPAKRYDMVPLSLTTELRTALRHPGWSQAAKLYELEGDAFDGSVPIDGEISTARRLLGEAKAGPVCDYIEDLLDGGVGKLVVAAHHSSVLKIAKERLTKFGLAYMDGNTPQRKRQAEVERFMKDPKCRIILGQSQVIGEGHTLTAAQDCLLMEPDWVPGKVEQIGDRIHRKGQKGTYVLIHVPVVPGSLDERIIRMAVEKDASIYKALDKQEDKKGQKIPLTP